MEPTENLFKGVFLCVRGKSQTFEPFSAICQDLVPFQQQEEIPFKQTTLR